MAPTRLLDTFHGNLPHVGTAWQQTPHLNRIESMANRSAEVGCPRKLSQQLNKNAFLLGRRLFLVPVAS